MPAVLWAIFIYVVCMSDPSALPEHNLIKIPHLDKFVHAFIFGVLTFLIIRGIRRKTELNILSKKTIFILLLVCIGYGAIIELVQHCFTTNRHGDFFDLLSDFFGALIGLYISVNWLNRVRS